MFEGDLKGYHPLKILSQIWNKIRGIFLGKGKKSYIKVENQYASVQE